MNDFFDPIEVPDGFTYTRSSRLERLAGEFGVCIFCRWVGRGRLVTSRVESLTEPIQGERVADFEKMTLSLAPPKSLHSYYYEILRFSREFRLHLTGTAPVYERVIDVRDRTHLVLPLSTNAVCGSVGPWGSPTEGELTCKGCIRAAMNHKPPVRHPLDSVVISDKEREFAKTESGSKPKTQSKRLSMRDVISFHADRMIGS